MRLLKSLGNPLWAAVFALVLPVAQARAASNCVDFDGLRHCSIGSAQLTVTEDGLKVTQGSTSGSDGVNISMPLVNFWSAETATPPVAPGPQRTVFTSVSESSSTSTATVVSDGPRSTVAASFTGSGAASTYSVMVYRQGVLQAAVGGVRNGQIAARLAGGSGGPSCREWGTTYDQCVQNNCKPYGYYPNCNYCNTVCARPVTTFHVMANAACRWTLRQSQESDVTLSDGRTVRGDEIYLVEEVRGPSSYPYLGFNQILMQTTAPASYLANEYVVPANQ